MAQVCVHIHHVVCGCVVSVPYGGVSMSECPLCPSATTQWHWLACLHTCRASITTSGWPRHACLQPLCQCCQHSSTGSYVCTLAVSQHCQVPPQARLFVWLSYPSHAMWWHEHSQSLAYHVPALPACTSVAACACLFTSAAVQYHRGSAGTLAMSQSQDMAASACQLTYMQMYVST